MLIEGYYWTINSVPAWTQLVFDEGAGASTEILAGDVVLRNAPPIDATSPARAGLTLELYLPPGYLRMHILTKAHNAQARVAYNYKARAWCHAAC